MAISENQLKNSVIPNGKVTWEDALLSGDTAKRFKTEQLAITALQQNNIIKLVEYVIEPIIKHFGGNKNCIRINTFFRSPQANNNPNISGTEKSQHLANNGAAVDLHAMTMPKQTLIEFIQNNLDFDQLIDEYRDSSTWVHVSYVYTEPGQPKNNKKQSLVFKNGEYRSWDGLDNPNNYIQKLGKIKFDTKNKEVTQKTIDAFLKYSKHSVSDKIKNCENMTYCLNAFQIVSSTEGGFDAINTYAREGIAAGFIQFAFPYKDSSFNQVLTEINPTLAEQVINAYGSSEPFKDQKSLKARKNANLLQKVQDSFISPKGLEIQLKYAIKDYFDPAFDIFNKLKFDNEGQNKNEDVNKYKIYACALIMDILVNIGPNAINRDTLVSKAGNKGINLQLTNSNKTMTEGNFIVNAYKIHISPIKIAKWETLFNENFGTGAVYS